jgi:hypothetical protein
MKVQCIVEVPLNAADITIGWFMDCKQLSNDSDISIESQVHVAADPEVRRIRSRLTINRITDDYAGKYTCNMLGDEEYVPGDQLELGDSEELELESSLGQCLDGGALFPGAIPAPEKCAVITEDNPVPMSLVCDAPPATSSQSQPTSTPVVLPTSTSLPHPSSSSSSSSSPTLSPTNLSSSAPSPTDPIVATSLPTNQDPTSIWLYVVVAIAAVFFMIIVVLAIVCVGMCVRRNRTLDGSPTQGEVVKITSMRPNTDYEGEFYPDSGHTASPLPPLPNHPSLPSPYNTMGSTADYETVGPGSNYQQLERPTLKATGGMMSRLDSIQDTFSPSTTLTSVYPLSPSSRSGVPIGGVPPPLLSTARLPKMLYSPESSATFDSAFHTGIVDISSPSERDRVDSTSMLIPKERKSVSAMGTGEFEGLYIPRGQRNSPTSPSQVNHPLQSVRETGASFPEPRNPHPFPTSTTYESMPGDDSSCGGSTMVASYERPLPSPTKSSRHPRAVTLPVSPPPPDGRAREATVSVHHNCFRDAGGSVTLSPHTQQELELATMSGPTYHTLEQSSDVINGPRSLTNGLFSEPTPPYPVVETADLTLDSESGSNTLTPGFPVVSADFADTPGDGQFPVSKVRPQRRQLASELSSDFTGESDYPQLDDVLTDCTGGSSTTAYPESEWTGGTSTVGGNGTLAGDSTIFNFNGRPSSHNGSISSARTVTPLSDGGSGLHRPSSTESSQRAPSYDGTPNRSLSNGETPSISPLNGMPSPHETVSNGGSVLPNGSCSVTVQFPRVPAGSSHTVPANSGGSAVNTQGGGPMSHTISSARNHYKRLDPTTMDPRLKYTRLNVGKLTVV